MRSIYGFLLIYLFSVFCVAPAANAEGTSGGSGLTLVDGKLNYSINAHMDVLEDPSRQWSLKDIQSPDVQEKFQPAEGKSSFGYKSSAYWVRVTVRNESSNAKWELSLYNSLVDSMKVYASGEAVPINRHYPTYKLNLPQGQTSTFYIRCEASGSMLLPLRLTEPSAVYGNVYGQLLMHGLYFGAVLIIVIFLLALYWHVRNVAYVYYPLSLLSFAVGLFIWNGLSLPIFGTDHWTGQTTATFFWERPSAVYDLSYTLGRWFGVLFLYRLLLPAKKALMTELLCQLMITLCPIVCLGIIFFYPFGMAQFVFWFKYVTLVLAMACVIECAWKGNRIAQVVALIRIPQVIMTVAPKALLLYGLFPDNLFTRFAPQLGVIVESIFMAFILFGLMAQMRKNEELAQNKLVHTLSEWNATLEKKVAEQTVSLQRANEELVVAEVSRTNLLQNIAHDIRSPLSIVQGGIQALKIKIAESPEQQVLLLDKVHNKVHDVNRFIDDLFALSQFEGVKSPRTLEMVMFGDWIEDIFKEMEADIRYSGHNCELVISSALADADVRMDPHLIKRVIVNLVNNACKFTPAGGTITLQALLCEQSVKVTVGDTGTGIGEEQLKYIFVRHYREGEAQGRGLGLAIAKEIVERHGGQIGVDSAREQGSQFYFTLPIIQ
ncbi:sensor histidine kinase [Cohnella soli]|uniref:histidine kinase n=1 Tax=Cohnella soli TaxID=425005 RepID=A0ABW0HWQ1_9BACL